MGLCNYLLNSDISYQIVIIKSMWFKEV